jgi:hypothetical protein
MAKVEAQRQQLVTERCEWLRGVVRVFFDEGAQAHALADTQSSEDLLDTGAAHESLAERAAGAGKTLMWLGASMGLGMRHAVKHKGGIGGVFLMSKKTNGSALPAPDQAASE